MYYLSSIDRLFQYVLKRGLIIEETGSISMCKLINGNVLV